MMESEPHTPLHLTPEQRRIVEHDEGPLVVIAGAGTGKTRVIVERVRHLLATHDDLLPEQLLVLTYNVKAARELQERIDAAVGPAVRGRMIVSNYHSFCHRILTESAAEAGMPPHPDVLDGIGQFLLLRELRPTLPLVYHTDWALPEFVKLINRAKDELVSPADLDAFVARECDVFEQRYGPYEAVAARLESQGKLSGPRAVRPAYAALRRAERAEESGAAPAYDPDGFTKAADKEARRAISGTGHALGRKQFTPEQHEAIDRLAATYVIDGAALEVMRLTEMAAVYRIYQEALVARGALDFGELISAVIRLFVTRPNLLRRWQRQLRYLLVDEFQDANIAQIELLELLARTPDRPANLVVVGDDDQSIYRFRGASQAAFTELDRRFALPPAHDPDAPAPGPPPRVRIEQNFRSTGHVLTAANRLIERNTARYEPDKRLRTDRTDGEPVSLVVCAGPEDEAVAIVDAIRAAVDPAEPRWSDMAVLYRKHKHREAIVARLREEDIPYTVVGGLSLFATPEIRDLEAGLRAIADPSDDVALSRLLTAGPWRLDALDLLRVTRTAAYDRRHLVEAIRAIVGTGQLSLDLAADEGTPGADPTADPALRARLRRVLGVLDELQPRAWREGPRTIVDRFLERSGQVLDLIAADTADAHRAVVNLASFLRFVADWQRANPRGSLADFVAYLDAYQQAGGELPASVELTEDVEGVRLMTLYQAKGLEFRHVFVPSLLENEWPTREGWSGFFPTELLREPALGGDGHLDEERRLLYVAMTRAQDRLTLTTQSGPGVDKGASQFVNELLDGMGPELVQIDRAVWAPAPPDPSDSPSPSQALIRRVMPLPSRRERRLAQRLRATELIGLLEGTDPTDPETPGARERLAGQLAAIARAVTSGADEARAQGLDPLTLRDVAGADLPGASLLQVAPLPSRFSYSAFNVYEACPTRYAFQYLYRIPGPETPVGAFTFGTTAHETFEAFTKERRERAARGEPPPTRADLEATFRARWTPTGFPDKTAEEHYQRRVATLLDNFLAGEAAAEGEVIAEELRFELPLVHEDGSPPFLVTGSIDRIDRLPSGRVEVIDYKTGKLSSQKGVDESLQLSIYALACRDVLGFGTPERVTLSFTESATRMSTTRTDEQLDLARADLLARASQIRSGAFAAKPGDACRYCDFARLCPSRAR